MTRGGNKGATDGDIVAKETVKGIFRNLVGSYLLDSCWSSWRDDEGQRGINHPSTFVRRKHIKYL